MEDYHPDYTIFKVLNNPLNLVEHLVVEVKSKAGDGWHKFLEQMYNQADAAKNNKGRLWAIGLKGLEIYQGSYHSCEYNCIHNRWMSVNSSSSPNRSVWANKSCFINL